MIVIIHATTYDKLPIHTIHMRKVNGNHFLNLGFSQSGIVTLKTRCIGQTSSHANRRYQGLKSPGQRNRASPTALVTESIIA